MSQNSLFVLGMDITWNEFNGHQAQLNISRPLRSIDMEKFKRRTIGESGDVNQKYDQVLLVDYDYAMKLEKNGALIPRREYQLVMEVDYSNPLSGAIVKELIPVDDEIKKHFAASMNNK